MKLARTESQKLLDFSNMSRLDSSQSISIQDASPSRKRKRQMIPDSSDEDLNSSATKKLSKRELSKPVNTPFLIPNFVFTKILKHCEALDVDRIDAFVVDVCKYWALKRNSKRGVPLLKRLILEVTFCIYF